MNLLILLYSSSFLSVVSTTVCDIPFIKNKYNISAFKSSFEELITNVKETKIYFENLVYFI